MVLLGDPLTLGTDEGGRRDGQGPPDGRDELLRVPHHERAAGGTELEDRYPPEEGRPARNKSRFRRAVLFWPGGRTPTMRPTQLSEDQK